jgi:hypothetical protein
MADLSPNDRDIGIRTIIGEDATDAGQAGVATVMLNRLASGKYGSNLSSIALAPNQFEPWARNPAGLMAIPKDDPRYVRAGKILDLASSGQMPDFTNGATHFYAPKAQAALGRLPPKWASGEATQIGQQLYYAPQGPSSYAATMKKPAPATSQADPGDDLLKMYTKSAPSAAAPTAAAPAVSDDTGGDDLLKLYTKAEPAGSTPATDSNGPGFPPEMLDPNRHAGETPRETLSSVIGRNVANTASYVGGQLQGVPGAVANEASNAYNMMTSAPAEKSFLPSFPSADPKTWEAGSALKAIAGAGGVLYSPVSGAVNQLVQDPVAQLTGSPDIAARAGLVANSLAGPALGGAVGGIASKIAPEARAVTQIKNTLGSVPPADAAARLAANPRLSLMDVNPELQSQALGLAVEPGQPAYGIMRNAVSNRMAGAKDAVSGAYDTALGQTPNVADLLDSIKQTAKVNGNKNFTEALQGAKPVDIVPVLKAIDEQLPARIDATTGAKSTIPLGPVGEELTRLRARLTDGNNLLTDPDALHTIQSQLGAQSRTLTQSASGQDRLVGGAVGNIRGKLVDAIDEATGGKFKPAQKQFADDLSIHDAFDKGTDIYKNTQLEDRPEFWQKWKENATPEQLEAAKLGMRVSADKAINGTRFSARNGTAVQDVPFNLDKMKIILGDDEATKLAGRLSDEKDIAASNNLLTQGSKTALATSARDANAVRKVTPSINMLSLPVMADLLGAGHMGGAALGAMGLASNYLGKLSDVGRNTAKARLLTAPGAQALGRIYNPAQGRLPFNALAGAPSALLGAPASANLLQKPVYPPATAQQ